MLIRLVIGCAWVDVERLMGNVVSDTTLRHRRDEWIRAGVFNRLADEAVTSYDRVIGLDLSECSVDGSQHKAPLGGEGTGPSPVDRGKRGWKWSLFADRHGIPLGWFAAGANRNDCVLLAPTLHTVARRGLLADCETLHLDRGYDNGVVRRAVADAGIDDLVCSKVRRRGTAATKKIVPLGLRWPIERTNSWALELWAAPPQHRPQLRAPRRPTRPRHHTPAHRQTHRLAKPMGMMSTYPLNL